MTERNNTWQNMRFRLIWICSMIFIQNLLNILSKVIKKFSCELMIFLVHKIFQKMKSTMTIIFEIKNAVDISSMLIISDDNRFLRFSILIRQRIISNELKQIDMKNRMNLHSFQKIKLHDKRVELINFDHREWFHIVIIKFDWRLSSVKIACI